MLNGLKNILTYYGGKTQLLHHILPIIPEHTSYVEPFCGGASVFFAKIQKTIEILNDTDRNIMNFYEVVKNDFVALQKKVQASLHSRDLFNNAKCILVNVSEYDIITHAWAVWIVHLQSFSSLCSHFGYDVQNTGGGSAYKIYNKKQAFTDILEQRLKYTTLESLDVLDILHRYDSDNTFFYCDPPYYNFNCGMYTHYKLEDYTNLLQVLSTIKGKFLLSSYPSDVLSEYTKKYQWHRKNIHSTCTVNLCLDANRKQKPLKQKIEVLTSNYSFQKQKQLLNLEHYM